MKSILLFGDSNTWGYISGTFSPNAKTLKRFDSKTRWPGILKKLLGADYHIIEEAVPGRTIKTDNPEQPEINGYTYLQSCLLSHWPLDCIVIMLGSNDIQENYNLSAKQIGQQLQALCQLVETGHFDPPKPTKILIVAPPQVGTLNDPFFTPAYQNVKNKIFELKEEYHKIAMHKGYFFADASWIVPSTDTDGIHLAKNEHLLLGRLVAKKLREIL